MGIYSRFVLPHVLNLACGSKPVRYQRRKIVPEASGVVLEVGAGSGLNFSYYKPDAVKRVIALEPEGGMNRLARKRAAGLELEVEFVQAGGEKMPLEKASADTVVLTYTLCSIPQDMQALAEMRRVLKPQGRLLFCEHGRAPDAKIRKTQGRMNPLWGLIGGGCVLNKDIPALIRKAGFKLGEVETMYLPGTPRFAGFNYWGIAGRG